MLSRLAKALSLLRDTVAVTVTDRWVDRHREYCFRTVGEIRNAYYWSRGEIPAEPLTEVVSRISGGRPVSPVLMPLPDARFKEVGHPAYHFAIACVVRALQPSAVLEIGTFKGVTTHLMLLNTDQCRIVTVDLPEDTSAESQSHLNAGDQRLVAIGRSSIGAAFRGAPGAERIKQVLQDSTRLNVREHMTSADLVFVDGGHTYELVRNDTEKAFEILSDHGVILWDDYGPWHPGVGRYLNEIRNRMRLVRIEGTGLVLGSRK